MRDFSTDKTTVEEPSIHFEDGVGMYSERRGHKNARCSQCFQERVSTREFILTEFREAGNMDTYRQDVMEICVGCLARSINAPTEATFFNGVRET